MAASLFTKPRYRKVLIIVASILAIAGGAGGTILLLRQFAPDRMTNTAKTATPDERPSLKKAEDLFAKGDYTGAKTQYQGVLETYKSKNDQASVKDIEIQLQIVDATAKAEKAPQNTDKGKVSVGSKAE